MRDLEGCSAGAISVRSRCSAPRARGDEPPVQAKADRRAVPASGKPMLPIPKVFRSSSDVGRMLPGRVLQTVAYLVLII